MLTIHEALKILNSNEKQKKYTQAEVSKILPFLYQLGEIAYLQFKQTKNNQNEKSNTIHTCIN